MSENIAATKMGKVVVAQKSAIVKMIAFEMPASTVTAEGNQPQTCGHVVKAASLADILGFDPRKVKASTFEPKFVKIKRMKRAEIVGLLETPTAELHADDQALQRKVMLRINPKTLATISPRLADERKRLEDEQRRLNTQRCQLDNQFCQGDRHEAPALQQIGESFARILGFAQA